MFLGQRAWNLTGYISTETRVSGITRDPRPESRGGHAWTFSVYEHVNSSPSIPAPPPPLPYRTLKLKFSWIRILRFNKVYVPWHNHQLLTVNNFRYPANYSQLLNNPFPLIFGNIHQSVRYKFIQNSKRTHFYFSLSQLWWAVVLLQRECRSEIIYSHPNPNPKPPTFLSWKWAEPGQN